MTATETRDDVIDLGGPGYDEDVFLTLAVNALLRDLTGGRAETLVFLHGKVAAVYGPREREEARHYND